MNPVDEQPVLHHEEWMKLIQSVMDAQANLIVLMHGSEPVVFNKAFCRFADVDNVKMFLREFGSLPNRFVPHDFYFHTGKLDNPEDWVSGLAQLDESERIVSMFSAAMEPHAFSVSVDIPVEGYAVLTFTDISQELIKRILIENDRSVEKESGAYSKDYFLHTFKSFQDAARYNKQQVGVSLVHFPSSSDPAPDTVRSAASEFKKAIRQSDMLVRWGDKSFVVAYFVDEPEKALSFSQKVLNLTRSEPFQRLGSARIGVNIQKAGNKIDDLIHRIETELRGSTEPLTSFI